MSKNKIVPDGWLNRLLQVIVVTALVSICVWIGHKIDEYKKLEATQKEKSV